MSFFSFLGKLSIEQISTYLVEKKALESTKSLHDCD